MRSNSLNLNVGILIAYTLLILLYFVVLKLLLTNLRKLGEKSADSRSVVDRDIRKSMANRIDTSMHTFNTYSLATITLEAAVMVLGMTAIVSALYLKFGFLVTVLMIEIAVTILWTINHWIKNNQKTKTITNEIKQYSEKFGNITSLVTLVFIMAFMIIVMTTI